MSIKKSLLLFALMMSISVKANEVIHFMPTEDAGDDRLAYILDIIKLSLEKTGIQSEAIDFKPLPSNVSFARAIHELKRDIYPNYFSPGGINIELTGTENLISVDFPLDHGLQSYRICFVSPKSEKQVSMAASIDDLKKFTIAQGLNWPDVPILKANGFKVIEVPLYTSLFKMVVSNRVDLVCRGVNELRRENERYSYYGNLIYDKSFVLIYPMPYKLYFNQSSAVLVTRIEKGLAIARQDGSLKELFLHYYAKDLSFAELEKRKQFILKSGYEDSFSENYKRFLYDPFSEQLSE